MNPFLRNPSAYQRTPIRAEAPAPKQSDEGVVSLRLYDPIDSWGDIWGVSAKEFVKTLDELPEDTKEIRLLVNSPGGHVWEGLAILNALRSHPAKVVAVVEGIAASAASFIAVGVDELHVMPNSEIMIHRAWALAIGNAEDMQKAATDLDHGDHNLASIYAAKAGGEVSEWLERMSAETFFSAEEAVAAGIADKLLPAPKKADADKAAEAKARFDLSALSARRNKAPSNSAPAVEPEVEPHPDPDPPADPAPDLPAVEPEQPNEPKEEDPVSDLSEIRSRLDLADDADETAIVAALDAKLAEANAKATAAEQAANEATEKVNAEASANADLRTEVDKLGDTVEKMSAKLAETEAQNAAKVKASVLDEAQRLGKFKPANRAQWETDYDEAPGVTTRLLARIQPGAEVPVNATGTAGSPEPDNSDDWDSIVSRLDGPSAKAV